MTTIALSYKAAQKKLGAFALPRLNAKLWLLALLVAAAALVVSYVYLVNQLTGGSYAIKSYNRQISQLEAENQRLHASFAESGFLGNVQEHLAAMDFEKTTEVTYVTQ